MCVFIDFLEFTNLPELTNNLQANTVYWRECAEELELSVKQQQSKAAVTAAGTIQTGSGPGTAHTLEKIDRNDSIYEDNESEIDK